MSYRVHLRITAGVRVYNAVEEMGYVPAAKHKIWVNADGFTREVVIDSEFGNRTTRDEITEVYLYCHPVRYND